MISKAKTKYIHSLELKKNRKAEGVFVAEGPKVVGDLMAVCEPRLIVATAQWLEANSRLIPAATEVCDVTDEELRKVSFLQHPQQVLAVFPQTPNTQHPTSNTQHPAPNTQHPTPNTQHPTPNIQHPAPNTQHPTPNTQHLTLALDGVQDPGNLGTIIRIADWFGIEDIYCSQDTADVWNPKVVQATMGSIARVRVHYCNLQELIDALPHDYPVYGTMLDGDDINEAAANGSLLNRGMIVMGNEGNGISREIAARVTHKLLIPNYPKGRATADSLNVAIATAITCFAIRRC